MHNLTYFFIFILSIQSLVSAAPYKHSRWFTKQSQIERRQTRATTTSDGPRSPRPTPEVDTTELPKILKNWRSTPPVIYDHYVNPSDPKRAPTACLGSSTTAAQINALFSGGGSSAGVLQFCPGATILLEGPIYFTAAYQGLQTLGGGQASSQATLKVNKNTFSAVAISTDCWQCDNLFIGYLIIDGSRSQFGQLDGGVALSELGGPSKGHSVVGTRLFGTRGWSSLHITQGGGNVCKNATITGNTIGPSGSSYGTGNIADGISLACANSLVKGNTIVDSTDGGIVIFASPGSLITQNTITYSTLVGLGGINMVDYQPWAGDYTNTRVTQNNILANSQQLKIGIAQGPAVWGDSSGSKNYGATVSGNVFSGTSFTFGMAVAGVSSWTVTGNTVQASARFSGEQTGNCHNIGGTVLPTFALYDPSKNSGTVTLSSQSCWTAGTFEYNLCYILTPSDPRLSPNPAFVPGGSCTNTPPYNPATNWKNSNYCVLDSPTRVLSGGLFEQTQSLTVEYCLNKCGSLQYPYAGLENGNQCYCASKISTGTGYGTVEPSSKCQSPCAANSGQICGGSNYHLSLYYDANHAPAPTLSGGTTPTSSSSSAAATQSQSGGGWSANSQCLTDGPNDTRLLIDSNSSSDQMTVQTCQSFCRSGGFKYAGLEYSKECWCSNQLRRSSTVGAASNGCSMPCAGNSQQTCGGSYLLNVYTFT